MNIIQVFTVVAVICANGVFSQFMPGFGGNRRSMMSPTRSMGSRYLTCIGQTANNDQLRVTFSDHQNGRAVKVQANIQGGLGSQINGNFQLVITNGGRIDGMCDSNSLGNIMTMTSSQTNRMGLFNPMMRQQQQQQQQQQRSQNSRFLIIGSQFGLRSDQSVSMTDILTGITYSRLAGSGMALCQSIVSNRCVGSMPLCCTIAKDGKTAAPTLSRGLVGGIGGDQGFGMNNGMNGMNGMNGLNGGMNNINGGMNGGMNNLNPNNNVAMGNGMQNGQNSLVFP